MDDDDEYADEVTQEDIDAEEDKQSTLMENAEAWQNFLDYVELVQSPWASEDEDTDDYRMMRAIELYNAGEPAPPPCHCARASSKQPSCLLCAQVPRLRVTSTN